MKSSRVFAISLAVSLVLLPVAYGQRTQVVPFREAGVLGDISLAYQPMPIIGVHGILAGRDTWNTALPALQAELSHQYAYAMTNPVPQVYSQDTLALYKPTDPVDIGYVHTFEYGCYGRMVKGSTLDTGQ